MSDSHDNREQDLPEGPVTGRQSIREVMAELRRVQEEEWRQEALQERRRRREAKESRIRKARARREEQVRAHKARRQNALQEANTKIAQHVAVAAKELGAALRDLNSVPVPRHSSEGREQVRVRRSLETALGAIRRVGRGAFSNTDFDSDFDPDFDSETVE